MRLETAKKQTGDQNRTNPSPSNMNSYEATVGDSNSQCARVQERKHKDYLRWNVLRDKRMQKDFSPEGRGMPLVEKFKADIRIRRGLDQTTSIFRDFFERGFDCCKRQQQR